MATDTLFSMEEAVRQGFVRSGDDRGSSGGIIYRTRDGRVAERLPYGDAEDREWMFRELREAAGLPSVGPLTRDVYVDVDSEGMPLTPVTPVLRPEDEELIHRPGFVYTGADGTMWVRPPQEGEPGWEAFRGSLIPGLMPTFPNAFDVLWPASPAEAAEEAEGPTTIIPLPGAETSPDRAAARIFFGGSLGRVSFGSADGAAHVQARDASGIVMGGIGLPKVVFGDESRRR